MAKNSKLDVDDSWIAELYQWADEYDIPDLQYAEPELDDDSSLLYEGYWFGLAKGQRGSTTTGFKK